MEIEFIEVLLRKYFEELDLSFDKLCHLSEGNLSQVPSYVFKKRHIFIFKFKNLDYYLIKAVIENQLLTDKVDVGEITSNQGIWAWSNPMKFDFDFNNPKSDYGMNITNINVRENQNINSLSIVEVPLLSIVSTDKLNDWFSQEAARKRAFDEWNNKESQLDANYSFVHNVKKIFESFESILNRQSFVERRLHRFINSHSLYILPSNINCHFEVPLKLNGEKRKADFILERETGLPPILVELESSFSKIFKKNEELTVYANHAGEQIKEWVKYIESNSDNSAGKFEFLRGKKERLVIVGRGLDCLEAMINTKYGEATVWTYDLLIHEAKQRWNKIIIDQCKGLNITNPNLL